MSNAIPIRENAVEMSFLGQCLNGYLESYFRVSHPCIIPPIQLVDDVGPSHDRGHSDDVSLPPPPPFDMTDQHHMEMITLLSNNLMSLVNLDGEVYVGLS